MSRNLRFVVQSMRKRPGIEVLGKTTMPNPHSTVETETTKDRVRSKLQAHFRGGLQWRLTSRSTALRRLLWRSFNGRLMEADM
jgi:hypothetical protein